MSDKQQQRVVSIDEEYQFVTSQCVYCHEKFSATFSLFIKIISTLAGGIIWLKLQDKGPQIWPEVRSLAISLLGFLGACAALMMTRYTVAWWGFRNAESGLNPRVPRPRHFGSYWVEMIMIGIVLATTIWGAYFLWRL